MKAILVIGWFTLLFLIFCLMSGIMENIYVKAYYNKLPEEKQEKILREIEQWQPVFEDILSIQNKSDG